MSKEIRKNVRKRERQRIKPTIEWVVVGGKKQRIIEREIDRE